MLSKVGISLTRSIVPRNPRESQGLSFLSWVVVDWGGGGGWWGWDRCPTFDTLSNVGCGKGLGGVEDQSHEIISGQRQNERNTRES